MTCLVRPVVGSVSMRIGSMAMSPPVLHPTMMGADLSGKRSANDRVNRQSLCFNPSLVQSIMPCHRLTALLCGTMYGTLRTSSESSPSIPARNSSNSMRGRTSARDAPLARRTLASATETVRTALPNLPDLRSAWMRGHTGLPSPNAGMTPSAASLSAGSAASSDACARVATSRRG